MTAASFESDPQVLVDACLAAGAGRRTRATPKSRPETRRTSSRWPLVLCALVATYCGLIAVIRSPLGQEPPVRHAVQVSRATLGSAVQATVGGARALAGLDPP